MIVDSNLPDPGSAASTPSESSDADRDPAGRPEGDPLRQLFRRHANHHGGALTRGIQARLQRRLFASGSELA